MHGHPLEHDNARRGMMVRSGQTVPTVPLPYQLDTQVSLDLGQMGQLGQGNKKEEDE